jgi:hypothetical protein
MKRQKTTVTPARRRKDAPRRPSAPRNWAHGYVAADAFFAVANDLVVNTAHAWSIGVTPDEVLKSFPKWIDPKRVLVFHASTHQSESAWGITVESSLGVHHINLFSQPKVHTTIRNWLSTP